MSNKATDPHYLHKVLPPHGVVILAQNETSAFLQPFYPYGNGMFCIRRCWTETCLRPGHSLGKRRLVTQTSHSSWNREYTQMINRNGERYIRDLVQNDNVPRMGITWNAVHPTTYAEFTCWIHPRNTQGQAIEEMRDILCPFVLHSHSNPNHYRRLREYFRLATAFLELTPFELTLFQETSLFLEAMEKVARKSDPREWQAIEPIFLGRV